MFVIISILAQIRALPPLTVSDAGVTVKDTSRPQLEQAMPWDGRVLEKEQHFRLTLFIAPFLNKVLPLSINLGMSKQNSAFYLLEITIVSALVQQLLTPWCGFLRY